MNELNGFSLISSRREALPWVGVAENVGSFDLSTNQRLGLYVHDPEREDSRVLEIGKLDLTAEKHEARFAPYADQAARDLGMQIGIVSFVLSRTQHLVAMHGGSGWLKEARCTPIEWSFCANAVRRGWAFIVQDATKHPIVCTNPLVTHNGIRCYAGAPVTTSTGITIGALAVMGNEPRNFMPHEIDHLHTLAAKLSLEVEQLRSEASDCSGN